MKILSGYAVGVKRDPYDDVREQWQRERPDLDASGLEVMWRISFLHKDLRRSLGRKLSRVDLSNWAFEVLSSLRRQGPPYEQSPSALCQSSMLTSGAMTNRLDHLEAEGLIERRPDAADRRVVNVRLTSKGKKTIDEASEIRFDQANQALEPLSEPERETLIKLLRKLVFARVMA